MTREQAQQALENHIKIEAGEGNGYDTGYILSIDDDGHAIVGWDTGVRTLCAIADLTLA